MDASVEPAAGTPPTRLMRPHGAVTVHEAADRVHSGASALAVPTPLHAHPASHPTPPGRRAHPASCRERPPVGRPRRVGGEGSTEWGQASSESELAARSVFG